MISYHGLVRSEIAPLLPKRATCILDVGCGIGATAAWVKSRFPGSRTIGLEGDATLHDALATNVDVGHIVDLDGDLPDLGGPDLVLLLDVLEHLRQPERVLESIVNAASADAWFIISLPNVAHLSVSLPLLLHGRFDYSDMGILDRTHLHFYTPETALQLARRAGLTVRGGLLNGLGGPRARWLDRLTLGRLRSRLAKQVIFSATRDPRDPPAAIGWAVSG